MKLRAYHTHTNDFGEPLGGVVIDIDTDGDVPPLPSQQRTAWRLLRKAFFDTCEGDAYPYHDGRRTHSVTTIAEFAAVTRRERALWGVVWREDPKVV